MTQFNEAIVNFHKADRLEKTAKEMRTLARAQILAELEAGNIKAGKHTYGDHTIEITVPVSKGTPMSFDQSKAQEFRIFCEDTYQSLLPAFTETTVHEVNIEVLMALLKAVEADKTTLLTQVEKFLIPAVAGSPMEPRVKAS